MANDPDNYTHGSWCGFTGHGDPEAKRSFRLDFSRAYGAEGSWFYPAMKDFPEMQSAKKQLQSIVLRAGQQENWAAAGTTDVTFLRDPFYRTLQVRINEDGIASHTSFAHLYLNGQYWGLYNIAERPDDKFAENYMGGASGDYFAVEGGTLYSSKVDPTATEHSNAYRALFSQIIPSGSTLLQVLPSYVDVPRFLDYLLITWFVGMNDWPTKNYWVLADDVRVSSPYRLMQVCLNLHFWVLSDLPQWYAWGGETSLGTGCTADGTSCANPGAWVHPDFRNGVCSPGKPLNPCVMADNQELPNLWAWIQMDNGQAAK